MPTVDPKPRNRPFRRVLYREDSKDSTVVEDVTPRISGHLITLTKRSSNGRESGNVHVQRMTTASRKLLANEGTLYKSPRDKIKYIKRIPNDPMARYLFHMKKYNHSSQGIASVPDAVHVP